MVSSMQLNPSLGSLSADHDLLLTLEEVSQLVSHSHNQQETFQNICELIQKRFHTAVCSIYIAQPHSEELVLAATVGLNQAGIGRVRMTYEEGLTGLVAQTMAPVVETNAPSHPGSNILPKQGGPIPDICGRSSAGSGNLARCSGGADGGKPHIRG